MTAVVDYGVGNLFSLKSSLAAIGEDAVVTRDEDAILGADRVILPGVGAFSAAREKLAESGLEPAVMRVAASGKPMLGICVGHQLLFDRSFEYGCCEGLGLIRGEVKPFEPMLPEKLDIPQMGWNALRYTRPCPLFDTTPEGSYVYFVHSYAAFGCEEDTVAVTEYGVELTAAVWKDNIFGVQFHPEKSGDVGLGILRRFCAMR